MDIIRTIRDISMQAIYIVMVILAQKLAHVGDFTAAAILISGVIVSMNISRMEKNLRK